MTIFTFICPAANLNLRLVQPVTGHRRQPLSASYRCQCKKRHSALFLFLAQAFGDCSGETG